MTQDEIIRMAREAGLWPAVTDVFPKELERFAALVAEPWIETNKALAKEIIELKKQAEQEPVAWQGAEEWEPLAFQLCADENGEESCNELLWDGGVIPEPWGERWLKYEDEAKRMIEYVRKYAAPVRTKDLTEEDINELWNTALMIADPTAGNLRFKFARAVIAADREKNK